MRGMPLGNARLALVNDAATARISAAAAAKFEATQRLNSGLHRCAAVRFAESGRSKL